MKIPSIVITALSLVVVVLLIAFFAHASTPKFIASYGVENFTNNWSLGGGTGFATEIGQGFALNHPTTVDSVSFYLAKRGLPTGYAVAKIYKDNMVIASSKPLDVSTIQPDYNGNKLFDFIFDKKLPAGQYKVTLEYDGGDINNSIQFGSDLTNASGRTYLYVGTWYVDSTSSAIYYIE